MDRGPAAQRDHDASRCPDCHSPYIYRPFGPICPHCDVVGPAPEPEWVLPSTVVADICRQEDATAAMLAARGGM